MNKLLSMLLLLAALLALGCCALAEAPAFPVTLTDQAGREVTIQAAPERLISGYYISTSALIALGLEDDLVGIEAKANKRAIYALSAPQLASLPSVGTAKEFSMETCLSLDPDLVILPMKLRDAAETLASFGIPALLVNPENQALLREMISLLADATGAGERAAQLLGFTDAQQARLDSLLTGAPRPRVYLAGNSAFLSTAGGAMYQSDLIRLAGGENVASALEGAYWTQIDEEQLLKWNPEVIVLASDAAYTVDDVLANPAVAGCDAVKTGRVFAMPSKAEAWDSPVPGGILGALWLANAMHPELLGGEALAETIDEYYETFYGFTYSAN